MTKITAFVGNFQPDVFKCKLKYFVSSYQAVTAGSYSVLQWSGNSAYDPEVTFIGATSNLWSWCSQIYRKYMCTYSKIKVVIHSGATACNSDFLWLKSSSAALIPTTLNSWMAQPYRKYIHQYFNALSEPKTYTLKDHCSTTKILGRKLDPSIDRVAINADPGEEWVYSLRVNNYLGSTKTYYYDVYITYWVEFSDREVIPST